MGERGIELKDLIGLAKLDAVDFETVDLPEWEGADTLESCNVCRFRLNGTVYVVVEDPSDGYRSSMRAIKVAPKRTRMANRFPPVQVLCRHKDRSGYNQSDLLELIDVITAKVVLEVGTDNSDDYYPSFVANFQPENMATNTALSKASPSTAAQINGGA